VGADPLCKLDVGGAAVTFDPTQNRVPTCLLTADELAALKAAKHGVECFGSSKWFDANTPTWAPNSVYRAKPAPRPTIICNGVEVPEPVREALEQHQAYWFASPLTEMWFQRSEWTGDYMDKRLLARGLIHLSEADAASHAKAMVKAGCV